ncbi:hypothetical protein [Paraburkholderia sp. HD33-4]|uniref:hypothetical protein n=1 Tax=Paraburkholderia sp. HD33-4 TaxID=2883242 RepID=UPI001F2C2D4D|nr:hypothetical protein [Paraburkholderia sp. HD33-4]
MTIERRSLKEAVETWLTPNGAVPLGIELLRRHGHRRYVIIKASRATEALFFYFFRHPNGDWCVFPPN